MDVRKSLGVAAAMAAVALPSAAHRGPEPHPTVQELEEKTAELRVAIGDVERRLLARMDGLDVPGWELDDQAIATAAENAVGPVAADLVRSSGELKARVDAMAVVGAGLLAGLAGLSGFLGFRLRAMRRLVSERPSDGREAPEAGVDSTDTEREEAEERGDRRRIVTHTLKDRIRSGMQPTVKELHCPGAGWSPRARDEAITDILERGIRYWARGPLGNEAEIEVRRRLGKPYLSTKPDQHGGNNLGELPDPP